MESLSRLNPVPELAEEVDVLGDPAATSGPLAEGGGIPLRTEVLEILEHRHAGGATGSLRTVQVKVSGELTRAQETRQMRVVDQRGEVVHRRFEHRVQADVGRFWRGT